MLNSKPRSSNDAHQFGSTCCFESLEGRRLMSAGQYDLNFSDDGRVVDPVVNTAALAVQDDGKYIIAGTAASPRVSQPTDFGLARYRPSGTLDNSFGSDGHATTSPLIRLGFDTEHSFTGEGREDVRAVAVDGDGKIIVGGVGFAKPGTAGLVTRLNADGSVDASFGQNGVAVAIPFGSNIDFNNLRLDGEGRIVYVGFENDSMIVGRLTPGGLPDPTFNGGAGSISIAFPGVSTAVARSLDFQAGGKIVVGGLAVLSDSSSSDFALARLKSDGTLDDQFGASGRVLTSFSPLFPVGSQLSPDVHSLAVAADGRIWAVGTVYNVAGADLVWAMARYLPDGSLDPTFRQQGIGKVEFSNNSERSFGVDIDLQPDGKAVVVGSGVLDDRSVVGRLRADDGELDTTFAQGDGYKFLDFPGVSGSFPAAVDVLPDGNILTAASAGLARLQGDSPQPAAASVMASGSAWDGAFRQRLLAEGRGDASYGVRIVDDSGQRPFPWNNVDTFTVRFASPVAPNVTLGSVIVTAGGVDLPVQSVTVDSARTQIRLAAPLPTGIARLRISGTQSEDGGTVDLRIPVLVGDVNQSGGAVNASDLVAARNRIGRSAAKPGTGSSAYGVLVDVNADGVVNAQDLVIVRNQIGSSLPAFSRRLIAFESLESTSRHRRDNESIELA